MANQAVKSPDKLFRGVASFSQRRRGFLCLRRLERRGGMLGDAMGNVRRRAKAAGDGSRHIPAPMLELCLSFLISHLLEPASTAHSAEGTAGAAKEPVGAPARGLDIGDPPGPHVAPSLELRSATLCVSLHAGVCTGICLISKSSVAETLPSGLCGPRSILPWSPVSAPDRGVLG